MESAPSGGGCYIDDLPDEIFALILNLLPIEQVIRCAIVSKRWDAACRYIIRTCDSLCIGNDWRPAADTAIAQKWGWRRERPSMQLSRVTRLAKSLAPAMMRSLNQMEDLTRLCVVNHGLSKADISPFIRKFTEQLTMLEIDFAISVIGADAFPHLTRLRCRYFDAKSSAAFPKLTELFIYELKDTEKLPNMRLPSLKKMLISKWHTAGDEELVRGFILANAKNLTVLQMSGITLQSDPAVVFPNLIRLDCQELDDAAGCSFPALTHLMVAWSPTAAFLSSLPAEQIQSLGVGRPAREIKYVVFAISKMKNLTSLTLTEFGYFGKDDTFSSIFDNMHHLEHVRLSDHVCQSDRMIATLANQNPKLSNISFRRIGLTDAGLTSLAQLQHLTNVSISYDEKVTTSGVLTLLRGSSRNFFRKLSFDKEMVTRTSVTREIRLMCKERGTTFRSQQTSCCFEFDFHA